MTSVKACWFWSYWSRKGPAPVGLETVTAVGLEGTGPVGPGIVPVAGNGPDAT